LIGRITFHMGWGGTKGGGQIKEGQTRAPLPNTPAPAPKTYRLEKKGVSVLERADKKEERVYGKVLSRGGNGEGGSGKTLKGLNKDGVLVQTEGQCVKKKTKNVH